MQRRWFLRGWAVQPLLSGADGPGQVNVWAPPQRNRKLRAIKSKPGCAAAMSSSKQNSLTNSVRFSSACAKFRMRPVPSGLILPCSSTPLPLRAPQFENGVSVGASLNRVFVKASFCVSRQALSVSVGGKNATVT
jgi:hypothetical protein